MADLSGGWLILGWCYGFEIWDGADGFEICGCVDLSGCLLFFLKVTLVDVGLCRWWISGDGCGFVLVVGLFCGFV